MTFERSEAAFRTISQIGIRYPKSPLSQDLPSLPEGAPVAGDRFPWMQLKLEPGGPVEDLFQKLDDTCFNLLAFGQRPTDLGPAHNEAGDLLRVYMIPEDQENEAELERAKIPQPSFYLLRPDGHVGLSGTRLEAEAVRQYLREQANLMIDGAPKHVSSIQRTSHESTAASAA